MRKEEYPKKLMQDYDEIAFASNPQLSKLRNQVSVEIKNYFATKNILILEIGSGNGETTEFILKNVKNAKIIAIDKDENMVQNMKKNLKQYIDSGKLEVSCVDVFDFIKKLEDNKFDCFTSSWTIHNFEKERRSVLLKEILRILKPKGLFVTMDKYYPNDPKEAQEYFEFIVKQYQKFVIEGKKELYDELVKHESEDMGEEYIMREDECTSVMKSIGFKDIRIVKRILRESVLVAKK